MNTTAKILYDAADLIDANGWCQGEARSDAGCYCATAAMRAVVGLGANSEYLDALNAVKRETDAPFIFIWNDEDDRTVDQVTTALRNAAQTAEEVNR
jgi:hypothetical protein